jgi:hypothetical protein
MKLNNINFDKIESLGKPVPKGEYLTRVYSHKITKNRNGDPMITWQLVISEGEHNGRMLFQRYNITEKGLPYLKSFLEKCKFDWGASFDPNTNCKDVYGCEVIAKVDISTWQGEPRNEITGFIPVS